MSKRPAIIANTVCMKQFHHTPSSPSQSRPASSPCGNPLMKFINKYLYIPPPDSNQFRSSRFIPEPRQNPVHQSGVAPSGQDLTLPRTAGYPNLPIQQKNAPKNRQHRVTSHCSGEPIAGGHFRSRVPVVGVFFRKVGR